MGIIKNIAEDIIKDKALEVAADVLPVVADAVDTAIDATAKAAITVGKGASAVGNAVRKTTETVNKAVDKTFGDKDERRQKAEQRYLKKHADGVNLIIKKIANTTNELFTIVDVDGALLYSSQKYLEKKKYLTYTLDDSKGKNIGCLRNANKERKLPLIQKKNPLQYKIEIKGVEAAIITEYEGEDKAKYAIYPSDWTIDKVALRTEYRILENGEEIAHIKYRKGYETPTYFLDFKDETMTEILILISIFLINE